MLTFTQSMQLPQSSQSMQSSQSIQSSQSMQSSQSQQVLTFKFSNPNLHISYPRMSKILDKLCQISAMSKIIHQHAAVVIYNGDPVAWGFNTIRGNKSIHAEIAAIYQFLCDRGFAHWANRYCTLWPPPCRKKDHS